MYYETRWQRRLWLYAADSSCRSGHRHWNQVEDIVRIMVRQWTVIHRRRRSKVAAG
jgi:predicted amidophosphoribosyltransferase